MFGWINDCTECLVITKFGQDIWHEIKQKAGCEIPDGGFLRYKYYPDSDTVSLVVAASEVLGISVDDVLFAFGDYFVQYVQENGYSNVLECLGSNLRDWLSNLNSLHDHLQASYPKGFVAPVFWSEDDTESDQNNNNNNNKDPSTATATATSARDTDNTTDGKLQHAILVHYFSHRGSLLVPLVVGLIKRIAREYFSIEINMDQLQLQDESNGVKHTTWRVTTVNPEESYKLRGKKKSGRRSRTRQQKRDGSPTSNNSTGDGGTVSTTPTTSSRYERTFREGRAQASNLRVEEVIQRSIHNPQCELHHALTKEHYVYLYEYWKVNKVVGPNGDQWCYEVFATHDDDDDGDKDDVGGGKHWATLADLPDRLKPSEFDTTLFGGKIPQTGAYPPNEDDTRTLQSFPPKVVVVNDVSGRSQELIMTKSSDVTLQRGLCDPIDTDVKEFPSEWLKQLNDRPMELKYVVWDVQNDKPYHTFTLDDLDSTSTQQFYDLVPPSYDPIKVLLQCDAAEEVGDDEEDI